MKVSMIRQKLLLPSFRPRSSSHMSLTPKPTRPQRVFSRRRMVQLFLLTVSFCLLCIWKPFTVLRTASPVHSLVSYLRRPVQGFLTDVTRSAHHKASILPSVTFVLNSQESEGKFPPWYGNPTDVGLSPFDWVLSEEWQTPRKWMFFIPKNLG